MKKCKNCGEVIPADFHQCRPSGLTYNGTEIDDIVVKDEPVVVTEVEPILEPQSDVPVDAPVVEPTPEVVTEPAA